VSGLTGADIHAAVRAAGAGSGLAMPVDDIAVAFNDAILTYGDGHFSSVEQVAALVSECMMESAYFRTTEEYAKHGRYAPYIGRTFIQITWKDNYAAFGAWCHDKGLVPHASYFVDEPTRLAAPRWAALGGVWYFTQVRFAGKPLTAYAHDILAVGRAVNLGSPNSGHTPSGQRARAAAYRVVKALGPSIIPIREHSTGRPLDMAATQDVYLSIDGKQALAPGENEVLINADNDKSLVVGPNAGVDLLATLSVVDGTGQRYTGPMRSFFRVISYQKTTPTTTLSSRVPTTGDQVSFKGPIKALADGRSPRLRLVVEVPPEAPGGLVLDSVQVTGWTL
jgi:hypothetical protein